MPYQLILPKSEYKIVKNHLKEIIRVIPMQDLPISTKCEKAHYISLQILNLRIPKIIHLRDKNTQKQKNKDKQPFRDGKADC